jgi:hypothetical protein
MAVVKGGEDTNLVTGYSKNEDSFRYYGWFRQLAQTFTLHQETAIFCLRAKILVDYTKREQFHAIHHTDGAGAPTGPPIATRSFWSQTLPYDYQKFKWRRPTYDFPILAPGVYAYVISCPIAHHWQFYKWRSDATSPPYMLGMAFESNDHGVTWTPLPGEDFMFEVWGYTPPPEPPPEPAISNWAPTDIASQLTPTGYTIVVTTDIPVHLWMRWSLNEPLKRPSEEFRRGILLMSGVRWCFVNWHENEQEEDGDTLTHTFIKPNWPVCQTRWFYFLGTKQAEESPSASPIFHLHREAVHLELKFYEPWTEYGPPPPTMELIFLEPWTLTPPPPPTMELIFNEPWSEYGLEMVLIFLEPWTSLNPPAPPIEQKILEPWSS